MKSIEIKLIDKNTVLATISLVENIASKYVYNETSKEGIENFRKVNSKEFLLSNDNMTFVATLEDKVVGVIALRKVNHISLLFVDDQYFNQHIATELFNTIKKLVPYDLEVNSSTYALDFYHHLGFKDMDTKQVKDGITFTPMIYKNDTKSSFDTYDEFVKFMEDQKDRVYSLDNFKNYMNSLSNPQKLLNVIHIGGTNGKGSTTNYIKEVLVDAGYRVGTFTSPSLTERKDVIQINGISITNEEIVQFANYYKDIWLDFEISIFEIEVFIAVMYFIFNKVDYAIFEVGLGGTLDATNIVSPMVCVNTNIGLDHVDYLGHTYKEIALNKAGIVKEGIDYITGETRKECLDVFKDVCKRKHSNLITISKPQKHEISDNIIYDYKDYHIVLNTKALYQIDNSVLAINVLDYLKNKNLVNFTKENLERGLSKAHWSGRFEQIHDNPTIIIDGAHNKEGIDAFFESAKGYKNPKIIFSALKDKDTKHMISKLLELTDDLTITEFVHPRMASAKDLAKGFNVKIDEDYKHAIDEALNQDKTVFITGSLYFISYVIKYLKNK
ncbi:MAG: GNAT family N-acetyltransferase [Thomasclavelia sp.]|nr:GNAT family N-acetyltransferase [Thomasclavelia sp.]